MEQIKPLVETLYVITKLLIAVIVIALLLNFMIYPERVGDRLSEIDQARFSHYYDYGSEEMDP